MDSVQSADDAYEKLSRAGFTVDRMSMTADKMSLLMMQLGVQLSSTTLDNSASLLKAMALIVEEMGEMGASESLVKNVVESITSEDTIHSTAGGLVNEMWGPLNDLKRLNKDFEGVRDEAISWFEATKAELKAELKGEIKQSTAGAVAELSEAARVMREEAAGFKEAASVLRSQKEKMASYQAVVEGEAQRPSNPATLWSDQVHAGNSSEPFIPVNLAAQKTTASYAQMAQKRLTLTQRQALDKNKADACKVLFSPSLGGVSQGLEELSPEVLIAKADAALEALKAAGSDVPNGCTFIGAKNLAKGDVVYILNSPEAAAWLKRERGAFLKVFGATSKIVDAEWKVLIENVPAMFCITPQSMRGLEDKNSLAPNSIANGEWLVPPHKRRVGQLTAHLTFKFSSPESANQVIRGGMFVLAKRCIARKKKAFAPQCFKCLKVFPRQIHIAATCPSAHIVCGLCGGAHHSSGCELKNEDPVHHWCVNCQIHGHGANDRLCATAMKMVVELNKKNPEDLFKYFVVEGDEDTYELIHPDAAEFTEGRGHLYQEEHFEDWTPVNGYKSKQYNYSAGARKEVQFSAARWVNQKTLASDAAKAVLPADRTPKQREILEAEERDKIEEVKKRKHELMRAEAAKTQRKLNVHYALAASRDKEDQERAAAEEAVTKAIKEKRDEADRVFEAAEAQMLEDNSGLEREFDAGPRSLGATSNSLTPATGQPASSPASGAALADV